MTARRKHARRIGGQSLGSCTPLGTAVTKVREKRQRQELEQQLKAKSTSELETLSNDPSAGSLGLIARQVLQDRIKQAQEEEKLARSLRELDVAALAMTIDELERFAASSSGSLLEKAQALLLEKCHNQIGTLSREELASLALESTNDVLHGEARHVWLKNESEALLDIRSLDIEKLQQQHRQQRDFKLRSLLGKAIEEMKTAEEERIRAEYSSQSVEQLRAAAREGYPDTTKCVLLRLISEKEADARRGHDNQAGRPPDRAVDRPQTLGETGFGQRVPRVWVIKCTERPRDSSDGWHWKYYLSATDVNDSNEPVEGWGGRDWIRSPYSMKLLREEVRCGDLALCYQSDDEDSGRVILGLTQFASDGKDDPPGSKMYNCFDMIPPNDAFPLGPPLTIDDLYESGCHPKCFGRGTQGTVFPVEANEFYEIVRAIARQSAAQGQSLKKWLRHVCGGQAVPSSPVAAREHVQSRTGRKLPTKKRKAADNGT